jgi:hypothetical protein
MSYPLVAPMEIANRETLNPGSDTEVGLDYLCQVA